MTKLKELIKKDIKEVSIHYPNSWYPYRIVDVVDTEKGIRLDLINTQFEANGQEEKVTIHLHTKR